MSCIYKRILEFIRLTTENTVKDLGYIDRILNLPLFFNKSEIKDFFQKYIQENGFKKIKTSCFPTKKIKGNETISLIEIMFYSDYLDEIICLLKEDSFFPHYCIFKYWVDNFKSFDIFLFLKSNFYEAMINDNQSNTTAQKTNYSLINKNHESSSCSLSDKNVLYQDSYFEKFLVLVINNHCEHIQIELFLRFLSNDYLELITINHKTLPFLIYIMKDLKILHKYAINNKEDIYILENRFKMSDKPVQNFKRYFLKEVITTNTQLILSMILYKYNINLRTKIKRIRIINIDLYVLLNDLTLDFIGEYENQDFFDLLFTYVNEIKFDLELFLFSINQKTTLKYVNLKDHKQINKKQLFILYFFKKFTSVKKDITRKTQVLESLKEDVGSIISNEIYDYDVLLFIWKNSLDFGLFNDKVIYMFINQKIHSHIINEIMCKYFKSIIRNKIDSNFIHYKKFINLYNLLDDNNVEFIEELPDLKNLHYLEKNDLIKLLNFYLKSEKYSSQTYLIILMLQEKSIYSSDIKFDMIKTTGILDKLDDLKSNYKKCQILLFFSDENANIINKLKVYFPLLKAKESQHLISSIKRENILTFLLQNIKNITNLENFTKILCRNLQNPLSLLQYHLKNIVDSETTISYLLYYSIKKMKNEKNILESIFTIMLEKHAYTMFDSIFYNIYKYYKNIILFQIENFTDKDFENINEIIKLALKNIKKSKDERKITKYCGFLTFKIKPYIEELNLKVANIKE